MSAPKSVSFNGTKDVQQYELDDFSAAVAQAASLAAQIQGIQNDPSFDPKAPSDKLKYLQGQFAGLLNSNMRVQSALVGSTDAEVERRVKEKLDQVRMAQRIILVFLVDCTESMQPYIDEVKNKIKSVTDDYERFYGRNSMFFGFVGYRDHGISEPFEYAIDSNLTGFQNFLRTVRAHSEKDEKWMDRHLDAAEDVTGGLSKAAQLRWDIAGEGTSRVLIHIGDSPCHGSLYQEGWVIENDRYNSVSSAPGGEDRNCPIRHLRQLKRNQIHYYFCRIRSETDEMIKQFNKAVSPGWIETKDLSNVSSLASTVLKTLSTSVMRTAATSGNAVADVFDSRVTVGGSSHCSDADSIEELDWENVSEGNLEVGKDVPRPSIVWNMPKTPLKVTTAVPVTSLQNLSRRPVILSAYLKETEPWRVQVAADPFADGATRWAYHAQLTRGGNSEAFVMKRFKNSGSKWAKHNRSNYVEQIKSTMVAQFLAEQFNAKMVTKLGCKRVEYLSAFAAEVRDPHGGALRNYCMEPLLPSGSFVKWNNNAGHWDFPQLQDETLAQFAKFTFDATNGYMIIGDLQGLQLPDKYLLTDPVVLCKDTSQFVPTNLGADAIKANKYAADEVLRVQPWKYK